MQNKPTLRQQIEANGLILIAIAMVLIYWVFDSMASEQVFTRVVIVCLVIVYGVMTQSLINGRKAALAEKERTQEQLIQSESLAAIGQLVAGIAHELNNPLASASSLIQTDIELLEEQEEKRPIFEELRKDLAYSLKELNKTQRIVKSILDLSRQTQTYLEDVNMNAVIDEALQVLYNQYKTMDVVIEKQYDPDLPALQGNFSNLGQVLINIINNALQALPEGRGTLTLSTARDSKTESIVVTCRDTGVGIPPQTLKDIFKPFFTTKEVGKGTGLGLYISHEIVHKHGGEIRVSSEVGKGATFTINLPCRRCSAS
ncbi:MAG TPA: ATP-binding protein [Syntrophales bacterium]|nr:ATP-binding protein [Syntrophales bacterium]